MIIRKATQDDLRAIVEMSERFYPLTSYHQKCKIPLDVTHVAALTSGMIDNSIVHVAEVEDKVVGLIGLMVVPFLFNPNHLHVCEVIWWIDKEFRSADLGRALLQSVEIQCKDRGVTHIQMMHLANSPESARYLLESEGYELTELLFTKVI